MHARRNSPSVVDELLRNRHGSHEKVGVKRQELHALHDDRDRSILTYNDEQQ